MGDVYFVELNLLCQLATVSCVTNELGAFILPGSCDAGSCRLAQLGVSAHLCRLLWDKHLAWECSLLVQTIDDWAMGGN